MKKRYSSIVSPFVGNSKLTEYKDKKDSWIYNQMEKQKIEPGINVTNDEYIRFSAIKNRMAAKLVLANASYIQINKKMKQLSSTTTNNYRFQLSWTLNCDVNKSTVQQLNLVKDLLWSKVDTDIQDLNYCFQSQMQKLGQVYVDFQTRNLVCDCILCFTVNILNDDNKITQKLTQMGFDSNEY